MISPSVALALWLAVWGLPPSQPPPPTPSVAAQEKQQLSGGNANSGATSQPDIKSSQIAKENDPEEYNSGNADNKSAPDWITRFTGMLVLVSFLQVVALGIQVRFMWLTKCSFEIGERGRVFFDSFIIKDVENPSATEISYSYQIRNSGRTPVDVYEQQLTVHDTDEPLPDDPPYFAKAMPVSYTIGAGAYFTILGTSEKSKLPKMKTGLYLLGYCRFRDRFGTRHTSRYAVKYDQGKDPTIVTDKAGYNTSTS
jgi:hypothetical protein